MNEEKIYFKTILESIEEVQKRGPIPFIWGGIKEGSFGYIFGPSKSGKTTFCENLAMCLASKQKEFLGMPLLEKDHRVLFVHFEEYEAQRSDRNIKQLQFLKPAPDLINNLMVVGDYFPRCLKDKDAWDKLKDTINKSKATIVFIDSQTRASAGNIEVSDIARAISSELKEISYEYGITMIIIHHTPKSYGKPLSIDSLAGSHVLAQEADFILGINRFKTVRYYKEIACRYKREDERALKIEINDNMCIEPYGFINEDGLFEAQDNRVDPKNLNVVRTIIKNNIETTGRTAFKSKDILEEAEKSMDRSTYFKKLEALISVGEISPTGKGEYVFNDSSVT